MSMVLPSRGKLYLINSWPQTDKQLLAHPLVAKMGVSNEPPPLGLGFLGTYVRDHTSWDIEIIDPIPQCLTISQVLDKIADAQAVGLNCYADTRFSCFDFAKTVRDKYPTIPIIVGGPFVYFLDELIMKYYPYVDLIVRGEGEVTLTELLQGVEHDKILGLTWRNQTGGVVRNAERPFLSSLDQLYIDYNLLPDLDLYAADNEAKFEIKKLRTVYMLNSRGCVFQCSYCSNDHWNRTWRMASAEKVVEQMEKLVKTKGVQYFRFYDDLFTMNEKWVADFCACLKQKKLNIPFRVMVRAGTKYQVLKSLSEVGCNSVCFGLESGSEKVLKRINKGTTKEKIKETIKNCRSLNLWIVSAIIVSLPDETEADFMETVALTKMVDRFQCNITILFPYTPLYRELLSKGEVDDTIWFKREYEGRLLYVKENFPSAPFSLKTAAWLQYYSYLHYNIFNLRSSLKAFGLFKGLLGLLKAALEIPLHGSIKNIRNYMRAK